jgi:magnesium chelatase family protein
MWKSRPFPSRDCEAVVTSSAEIRGQARRIQQARGFYNAYVPTRVLRRLCALDDAGERTLEMAVRAWDFRPAHGRIPKVAPPLLTWISQIQMVFRRST